jgi:hypothetical protein
MNQRIRFSLLAASWSVLLPVLIAASPALSYSSIPHWDNWQLGTAGLRDAINAGQWYLPRHFHRDWGRCIFGRCDIA